MKRALSENFIKDLKEFYTPGTRVRLVQMNDLQAPRIGTLGVVMSVDDIGTIHVKWENGSTLGVIFGEDKIETIEKVVTICNHKKKIWARRQEAIDFFSNSISSSDGSEKERYTKIYSQLIEGKTICKDISF